MYPSTFAEITVGQWMKYWEYEEELLALEHKMTTNRDKILLFQSWVDAGEDEEELPYDEENMEEDSKLINEEQADIWFKILGICKNQLMIFCPESSKDMFNKVAFHKYIDIKNSDIFQDRFIESDFKVLEYESDLQYEFYFPHGVKYDLENIDNQIAELDPELHKADIAKLNIKRKKLAEGKFIVYHARDTIFQTWVYQDMVTKAGAIYPEETVIEQVEELISKKRTKEDFSLMEGLNALKDIAVSKFSTWDEYYAKKTLKDDLDKFQLKVEGNFWTLANKWMSVVTSPIELDYNFEEAQKREDLFLELDMETAKNVLAFFLALKQLLKSDSKEFLSQIIHQRLKRPKNIKKSGVIKA